MNLYDEELRVVEAALRLYVMMNTGHDTEVANNVIEAIQDEREIRQIESLESGIDPWSVA